MVKGLSVRALSSQAGLGVRLLPWDRSALAPREEGGAAESLPGHLGLEPRVSHLRFRGAGGGERNWWTSGVGRGAAPTGRAVPRLGWGQRAAGDGPGRGQCEASASLSSPPLGWVLNGCSV